ncbi:MAG TPA: hypothetical protein H9902_02610 [Candidatus Stackebrandtia faecavium]|nr:hypothetical protein [Candidatus Stackebrandtia faecavium]
MRIAIATCRKLPDLDEDEALIVPPLRQRGHFVEVEIWDDAAVNWSSYDAVIVRSCWDYQDRVDDFLDWAARVPRLHNPASVLRWNLDKTYLRALADRGVPTVPTRWIEPGDELQEQHGRWVLKPTVGAGSRNAGVYNLPEEADLAVAHVARLHALGKTVMAQPFLHSIESHGEHGLLYFGGSYSHTILKSAMLTGPHGRDVGLYKDENIASSEATPTQKAVAEAALAAAVDDPAELLYARVDLVETDRGPAVLELELSEPSLYYGFDPGSQMRMVDAIDKLER